MKKRLALNLKAMKRMALTPNGVDRMIDGLEQMVKSYRGHLRSIDSSLALFRKQPPLKGFERQWLDTRDLLRGERLSTVRIISAAQKALRWFKGRRK